MASAQFLHAGEMTLHHVDTGEALSLRNYVLSVHGMYGHRFKSTSTMLAAEGRYDVMWGASRVGASSWRNETYHFPALRLSMLQDFGEPWGMVAYALGGVASDMAGFGSGDFRITIGVGASYSYGANLKIIAGAMYTNMFDLPVPFLPLLDIKYRTGPATLRLSFPHSASAWLAVAPWMDLGVVIRAPNLRFTLHARDRIADEYGALTVTLGPVARVFAWSGLYLQGEGGYAVRNYKLYERERIVYERLDFKGWFVAASLGYMI
ncbi:MAG TPA: DUF6268 family outer membrane beta-barrel protein [Polyangiaceae bacterium]|nr:DUF6268 family outer membrane beta-barrel protein [Polyangiaceae bacterium]